MKAIRTIRAALVLICIAASPVAAQEGIEVGAVPEALVLQTLDGDPADLSEIIGTRPALIEFWASWCHICLALHPRVMAAQEKYGDDVEFIMVAVAVGQDPARIRQYMDRRPMPGMRMLWDAGGAAVRAFDAPGTGFVVVLDAEGRVVYTGTGMDQDIDAAVARAVNR